MIKATYSRLNIGLIGAPFYAVRTARFANLQGLRSWLGSYKPETVSFSQPGTDGEVNPIEVKSEGETISIHLIQNDSGVLFSTGAVKGTRPHISAMVSSWLKDCEAQRQRAIEEGKFHYVP